MKFKFCSDGDCPLWALAALHALSSLPSGIFRKLLKHVVEEQPEDGIMDILKDTSLSSRDECARAAAVIRWVLTQSWSCACSSVQLTRDLLVMGVPRAHATAFAEAVNSAKENHLNHVQCAGFTVNRLTDASVTPGPEDTVDTYKLSLLSVDIAGVPKRKDVLLDRSQVKPLLAELKKAYHRMEHHKQTE